LIYDPFAAVLCGDESPELPLQEEVGQNKEFWLDFIGVRRLGLCLQIGWRCVWILGFNQQELGLKHQNHQGLNQRAPWYIWFIYVYLMCKVEG